MFLEIISQEIKIIVMGKTNDQTRGLVRDCFFVCQEERRGRCFSDKIVEIKYLIVRV